MVIEINAIGLFHCRAGADVDEADTEVIRILIGEDLESYSDVREVTGQLLGRLSGKDFLGQKSARIHTFKEKASKPRGIEAISTRDLLSEILQGNNLEDNFCTLASWYLQTDYAQSGLLIISTFESDGESQLGILKAPFVDDVYEPDDEDILTELNNVIKGDLRKGILYPRITPDGERREDEVCLYQKQSSSRYPKHWFQYLYLDPNRTPEELLSEKFASDEENELEEAESTEEFDEILEQTEEAILETDVTVQIGGSEVKIELGELLRRDGVHLVESDTGYHFVISGDEPTIKFRDNRSGDYREVLKGIDSFDDLKEII